MRQSSFIETEILDGLITAPEFPENMEWLNTDKPIKLKNLRGKIILLDFWTYCCINCMHVIPDLKKLEKKYRDELIVIGVHSAKFIGERETASIRNAVLRYEIEHPVVNDRNMEIWSDYAIRAWPTLVLINPLGKIIGVHSGEGVYDLFDRLISESIRYFKKKDLIIKKSDLYSIDKTKSLSPLLSFPGKVLADEDTLTLFISDSNNNRILAVDLKKYSLKFIIGGGKPGFSDGSFEKCLFNHPQGIAFDHSDNALYIADTENHSIRKANLKTNRVTTIAGVGRQQRPYEAIDNPLSTPLNSPWDLTILDENLFIAMAGSHQIWKFDLKQNILKPYAGSGREALIDGSPSASALAQPSGITTDGERLFFADSETSSIRYADLKYSGEVKTLVGKDLFVFGDRDGDGDDVRLQHPLGVVYYKKNLYIADTYNNKIKKIIPERRKAISLCGTEQAGFKDGKGSQSALNEPGGISAAFDKLYIADINNHAVRVYDLLTDELNTIVFKNTTELVNDRQTRLKEETIKKIKAGTAILVFDIVLPPGHRESAEAPSYIRILSENGKILWFNDADTEFFTKNPSLKSEIHINAAEGETNITVETIIFHCNKENPSTCHVLFKMIRIPVFVQKDHPETKIKVILSD